MKNTAVKKIVSIAVLAVLCAATVAGVYLGVFGRTVSYADIKTDNGVERLPLDRQVAFIPNTLNENWQEAIVPAPCLGGGFAYTYILDNPALNSAARVMRQRAEMLSGSADTRVGDGTITVTVPETKANGTLASVLSTQGKCDFVLYNSADGSLSEPVLSAEHVENAYANVSNNTYQLLVRFNKEGLAAISDLRAQHSSAYLYLRLDGQPVAYTVLTAPSQDMLTFTTTDNTSALVTVTCLRSGSLPAAATLQTAAAADAENDALRILVIAVGAVLAAACVLMLVKARTAGLSGVWTLIGWVVLFSLFTALIADAANWIMTVVSLVVLLLCVAAFLCGLLAIYLEMGKQLQKGRAAYASFQDAFRAKWKLLAIVYGVALLVGVVLMVAFRTGMYGILGRIVAMSALLSFVMVFAFPRVVLGFWGMLTGKK